MKTDKRASYMTRGMILKTLSDAEIASVSTAETAERLGLGDEYLDLMRLQNGVQKACTTTTAPMGRVLPRKALQDATWSKILSKLSPPSSVLAR